MNELNEMNEMEQSKNRLFDVKQAAHFIGVKDYVFRNLFYSSDKKEPKPTRLGGRVFWSASTLDEWIIKNTGEK